MGIEIIGKKQLRGMDHQVLNRIVMVSGRYYKPESAQPLDKFQCMLRDFENCGSFAESTYDTMRSKLPFTIAISPDNINKAPY